MVEERRISIEYKMTESGVIPKDWENLKVKDLVSFSGGSQPPKSTFKRDKSTGYIRLIQIRDYKNDDYLTYIPEVLANKKCSSDDIMIGRYGPPIFQILRGIEGAYNVALLKASPKPNLEKEYLYYFLNQETLFNFVELLSRRSSGQTGVDIIALNEYPFPLPPLVEQKAIAEALSNIDNLIKSIKKLINKKKKIKQGIMQQLLTGKKRLPGFSGEWGVEKLGNISDIRTGKKNTEDKSDDGIYPFFIRSQIAERINSYSFDGEAILIPGEGGIGSIYHYIDGKFDYHQRVYKISNFDIVLGKYVYYYMKQNFSNHAMQNTVKATVDSLRLPTIEEFEIHYPVSIEEQKLIVHILTDMDSEIGELEQKLEKYNQIKQGMMKELLTGRIRLV